MTAAKTEAVAELMREFLATPTGKRFIQTPDHWKFLHSKLETAKLPVTVGNLVMIARELYYTNGYGILEPSAEEAKLAKSHEDRIRRQQQAVEAARLANDPAVKSQREQDAREAAAVAEKALFAEWEAGLPGMNPLQRLQYQHAMKDDYMKRKYPRSEPDSTPAASAIRNTSQELKLLAARAERQQAARNAGVIESGDTGNRAAFEHSQNGHNPTKLEKP
jgi:hypothetical protein